MFKFVRTDTFAATVHVSLPTNDPSKRQEGHFIASFKRLEKEETSKLLAHLGSNEITDDDVLDRVLVSISGIGDGDGNALPADEQMKLVRSDFGLCQAVAMAFFRDMGSAAEKNSAKSSRR